MRRLLEEQDKVLRSYFAQKGGREVKGWKGFMARVGNMSSETCMREEAANSVRGPKLNTKLCLMGAWGN